MSNTENKKNIKKENFVCYLSFLIVTAVMVFFYFFETGDWSDPQSIHALSAWTNTAIIFSLLILFDLVITVFFKQTIEKKILVLLGSLSIALGVLGFSAFISQNQLSFSDTIYRSFQLFIGEFGDIPVSPGELPLSLDIARFLALFVTSGTIVMILLKEQLYYLNIRLFYRDVAIITDDLEGYINDLKTVLVEQGRKVVIGHMCKEETSDISGNDVPIIRFDIDKDPLSGLKKCNIKKTRCIYLLCKSTADNMKLIRMIHPLFACMKKYERVSTAETGESETLEYTTVELLNKYIKVSGMKKDTILDPKRAPSSRTICYISYYNDEEREYYSADEVFTNRTENFMTYFINVQDTAIRQLLSNISLEDHIDVSKKPGSGDTIAALRNLNIGVAGSGELLKRAVMEISRICVFNDKTPMEIFCFCDDTSILGDRMKGLVKLKKSTMDAFSDSEEKLDILLLCHDSCIKTRSVLYRLFQLGCSKMTGQLLILAGGDLEGYEVLKKYVDETLCFSEYCPDIHMTNLVDSMLTVDDFYNKFGPTVTEIHRAYLSAISNNTLKDPNKLPEIFIESNLLSSLHDKYLIDFVDSIIKSYDNNEIEVEVILEIIKFLAITEHERWFNERTIQGCVYSEEKDYLFNRNSILKHWPELDQKEQEKNLLYLLHSMINVVVHE